jgi:hypothetical protein
MQASGGRVGLEMLKMKVEPTMCMKTQETMTKCHAQKPVFCGKCTHCAAIDENRRFSWQKMQKFRDNL